MRGACGRGGRGEERRGGEGRRGDGRGDGVVGAAGYCAKMIRNSWWDYVSGRYVLSRDAGGAKRPLDAPGPLPDTR